MSFASPTDRNGQAISQLKPFYEPLVWKREKKKSCGLPEVHAENLFLFITQKISWSSESQMNFPSSCLPCEHQYFIPFPKERFFSSPRLNYFFILHFFPSSMCLLLMELFLVNGRWLLNRSFISRWIQFVSNIVINHMREGISWVVSKRWLWVCSLKGGIYHSQLGFSADHFPHIYLEINISFNQLHYSGSKLFRYRYNKHPIYKRNLNFRLNNLTVWLYYNLLTFYFPPIFLARYNSGNQNRMSLRAAKGNKFVALKGSYETFCCKTFPLNKFFDENF